MNQNNKPKTINNSETIKSAFEKVNYNFNLLSDKIDNLSKLTKTSELINDGSDGENVFISTKELNSLNSTIASLNSSLNTLVTQSNTNTSNTDNNQLELQSITSLVSTLSTNVLALNNSISLINRNIAEIQVKLDDTMRG